MLKEIKNINNKKSDLRKFGITIGVILLIISGVVFWKEKETIQILITFGVLFCVLGVTIPIVLKPIYWVWIINSTILSWVMTRVILSFLFYMVITPLGLLSRLFGNQSVQMKLDHNKQTYWNTRTVETFTKNYENQF